MIGLSSHEIRDLTLSVGTHRGMRRLSPIEAARLIQKGEQAGASRSEIAAELGVGASQVWVFVRLLDLAAEIQHLADWRGTKRASIPFSSLAELARLNPESQVIAAEAILRHSLRWKEVVQLVQIANRSGQSIEDCISNVLKLRPQIETRHLFWGAILSRGLRAKLGTMLQADRDRLMESSLKSVLGSTYEAKGSLGDRQFIVVGPHDLARLLGLSADQIEKAMNEALEGQTCQN